MPIHPIGKLNRKGTLGSYYSITDYTDVNPEYGTLSDFHELVAQIHSLGMRAVSYTHLDVYKRQPYSVILLDEIEKAHPDIYNILLQVLDDGQLTDGLGRKVDFKNTMIIMTSNIGVRQLKDFGDGVGFATANRLQSSDENNKAIIEKALKRTFSPEFLNRIDDIVIFNSLTKENIFEIIDILMKGVMLRLANLGFSMEISSCLLYTSRCV